MTNTLGHAAGPPRRIPAAAAPQAAAVRASGGRGDASRSEAGARPEFSRFSHPHLCSRFLHPLPSPTLCFSPPRISLSPPHPPAHSPDSPDGTRTAPAAPFPRVPSFLHVSAEGKMLNSGRTGTWSPSRFHSAARRRPAGRPEPIAPNPGGSKSLRPPFGFLERGAAELPAAARLESPGKVLGASRKWLFGWLRRCSTFLDGYPAAQEPFQRTGLGLLFLERAATDPARRQQHPPRGVPCAPAPFQRPSTAFSARLSQTLRRQEPAVARPDHIFGTGGDRRSRPGTAGASLWAAA